uniref:Ubiquitin-like protease family profile domain-containing protein n=1 Tax=Magallana gigas TaxID=29159 RepID=A0A8W8L346_MAGGI
MVKKMSQNEVDKLIDNARLSSSISTDKVARTGLALLEQLFPSEDSDNSDYDAIIEAIINDAKKLCPGLEEQHTFRFALLLLWTLVKKGKFQLHRNIEKEDEEARNSMAACIEALNSIQSLNPDGKRIIDSQHPRSILKMKDKSTKCIRKKVHFEGEADLNQPLTQMDRNQALDAVKKLWSLRESSNYIIARVSNYNVTDDDFKSLASRNWLTDQLKVFECEAIVGAVIKHQHWTLVIVEPKKGLIYFYNPLTERRIQIREVQRNWCSYMGARMIAFNEPDTMQWKVETKEHSKQTDSFNCGVYCLLFAERHFSGQSITNITKMDLDNMRIQIATNLMMFEGVVPNGTLSYMWICDKERCKGDKRFHQGEEIFKTKITFKGPPARKTCHMMKDDINC